MTATPKRISAVPAPVIAALLVFAAILLANLWDLGAGPLAKTEGVRALTGHQIVDSGQWLVTHLYGSVYMQKPPLYYWIIATAEIVSGAANEWVWRMTSALGTALFGVFLWYMGRRWFGNLAGLVAGFSFLGLLTLWTQNRSAEIDALNNAMSVVCACALIELGFGATRRRWVWGVISGLAFGAALLLKGPAGLPVILGTLVCSSVFTSKWRWLRRPAVWLGLVLGAGLFLVWALAAQRQLTGGADISGLREVAVALDPGRQLRLLPRILAVPLLLLLYSFPVSAALPLAMIPSMLRRLDDSESLRVRAVAGAFVGALVVCVAAFVSNPRYGYMAPPLLCLLAGAVALGWERGCYGRRAQAVVRWIFVVCAVALAALHLALAVSCRAAAPPVRYQMLFSSILMMPAAAWVIIQWARSRTARGAWGLVGLLVLASVAFNAHMTVERRRESGQSTGLALREVVGAGARVHAETMVRYHPEVFYYAHVEVQRYPAGMGAGFTPTGPGWYLLHAWEWDAWGRANSNCFSRVIRLPGPDRPYLCRCDDEL